MNDEQYIFQMRALEDAAVKALEEGKTTFSFEASPLFWLDVFAEIRDRRPRNYSRLLADDTLDRLNDAIERLHREANFLLAASPTPSIAAGFVPPENPLTFRSGAT